MRDLDTHIKEYNRKEVIENFKWREGFIPLSLSLHAKQRVKERMLGEFVIVPTVCRITKRNIYSGRSKDGKKLESVKIRLEYTRDKWLYLVVCPNSGIVKTLFLRYKDAKKEKASSERQRIEKETKERVFEGEIRGWGESTAAISGNMEGEKESRWKKLFRSVWRTLRKRASFLLF